MRPRRDAARRARTERLCELRGPGSRSSAQAPGAGTFRCRPSRTSPRLALRGLTFAAVVLTRGAVHRVLELAVRERGAAGILFDGRRELPPVRGPLDDPDAVTYTSFWWSGAEPRGWGFVVSAGAGHRLRGRLALGAPLELEVAIESRAFETRIPLLSGVLPGRTEREVLIVSHLCHPRPSANDNASGAAANLESARALGSLARRGGPARIRSVRFLFVPEMTVVRVARLDSGGRADRAGSIRHGGLEPGACGSTFRLDHPPFFVGSFAEPLLPSLSVPSTG